LTSLVTSAAGGSLSDSGIAPNETSIRADRVVIGHPILYSRGGEKCASAFGTPHLRTGSKADTSGIFGQSHHAEKLVYSPLFSS